MTNPLLQFSSLPIFSEIKSEHVEPALDHVLKDARISIDNLLIKCKYPTWHNLVLPMEELNATIDRVWSPVKHLNAVMNSYELRVAYNACLLKISAFEMEVSQNICLYKAYRTLAKSATYDKLDIEKKKIIDNTLRDFYLSGIDLSQQDRDRCRDISLLLAGLTSKFEENLLDATHVWKKHIINENFLMGLPSSTKKMAAQFAQRDKLDGWLFTLHVSFFIPIMSYASNREFREEIYTAFSTIASDQGPNSGEWDNTLIITNILELRHEFAKLIGFRNYAEYSIATKMAESPEQVLEFLHNLVARSRPIAVREYDEIKVFAKKTANVIQLEAWDVAYFSEKLCQRRYSFSQEELKPYFSEYKVILGLFTVVKRIYGLNINERTDVDVWHKDVRFFDVFDINNELLGQFYLDLYARNHKRGGAWMDECLSRRKTSYGIQLPVAFLICNFAEPLADVPVLLTHEEVVTLFHEFGHCLHHILTKMSYAGISGINGVPWDAVEFPSQFMENWAWERDVLNLITFHYETHEVLPQELFNKMIASRNFNSAMEMMKQLELSLFDFRLYLEFDPMKDNPLDILLNELREQISVVKLPKFHRLAQSFSHIFSGSYAAGYYGYKWAEVLSADAFSKFKKNGIFNRDTGLKFLQSILEQGGSRDPMDLFIRFRGREPNIDALLKRTGIAISAKH
ncbi:MAG: M3 family metallopeptidase [Piscirickettsiaceae bacterium]|nr:M3 family metallopeptidase [Piscirickettsiaceae bacterium]